MIKQFETVQIEGDQAPLMDIIGINVNTIKRVEYDCLDDNHNKGEIEVFTLHLEDGNAVHVPGYDYCFNLNVFLAFLASKHLEVEDFKDTKKGRRIYEKFKQVMQIDVPGDAQEEPKEDPLAYWDEPMYKPAQDDAVKGLP